MDESAARPERAALRAHRRPPAPLTVGSLFSGIGGFDLGFQRAGFDIRWMVEREPFCQKVLHRRFPGVPVYDDVTTVGAATLEPVDVLVGGFPCQDVSIAGKRKGLAGVRSGLFFQFMRLVDELQPHYVVIENVYGLLTSRRGRDFHAVLVALADRRMRRAFRILDSRYFGVPQRRRRVFIVGDRGGCGDGARAVLFESARRPWDSAPRRQAGAHVAATLRGRAHGPGVHAQGRGGEDDSPIAGPLGGGNDGIGRRSEDDPNLVVAHCLTGTMHKRHDEDTDTLVVANALTASMGHHGHSSPRGDGRDNLIAATLNSGGNDGGFRTEPGEHLIASSGVRRLTPLECERLQAFPDGWTCLCGVTPYSTAACACPDTPRYKALGNAVTVSVAEWLARRLVAHDAALDAARKRQRRTTPR